MSQWSSVSDSLALLTKPDRRKLGIVTLIQMLSSLLDAAGVALFGIVAAMATSSVSGTPLPSMVTSVLGATDDSPDELMTRAIQLAVIAGVLLIAKSVVNVILTRRVLRFLAYRQAVVSGQLAATLLARPLIQVQRRQSQETAFALTTGVNAAMLGVLGQAVTVCAELSLLAVLALGLLALDPVVAIFAVAFFAGIALILQRIMSSRAHRLGQTNSAAEVASMALVQESVSTYREVLVSNRRHVYVDRFQALRWTAAQVQADLSLMSLVPKYVFEVALIVGAGLLAWSQFLLKDASAAMGTIAIFLAAGSRVVPSMLRLQGATLGIRVTSGMARPTIELANELAETSNLQALTDADEVVSVAELTRRINEGYPDFQATIQVRDVTFSYEAGAAPSLREVSLDVTPGSSVALVGPTGAGKSTLSDAILGVVQPVIGSVLIGGLPPLEAVTRWPGALAYVPQTVAIATGTIRENVALGLPLYAIDDDRVWEALRAARLDAFLKDSREGLDTIVGESGVRLSGGQRQRLGIARALYTRPRLMVLDEATSALDAETERAIVDTLQELEGEVTIVTVAHRLATVRHCDLVVYLESGSVVARGSFDEVIAAVPNFAQQAHLLGLS
ncbi:MAG: ABC transporter ATP-binding protein [Actinomycetota bacterium]|nr:ABC transporter ATP-binding protein [Actinomycetota bacterium]